MIFLPDGSLDNLETSYSDSDSSSENEDTVLSARGQITVDWQIKDFFNLPRELNYRLDSHSFLISDARFYLVIYPNGHTESSGPPSIGFYLFKKPWFSSHRIMFTLGIRKVDGAIFKFRNCDCHLFKKDGEGCGWPTFLQRVKLLKFRNIIAPHGALTVFCTARRIDGNGPLEVSYRTTHTSTTESVESLSQNFKELYESKRLADVTFNVEHKTLLAHKLVLSARSTVFRAMFEAEREEKQTSVVTISDCDPDCFEAFLIFLYTGKQEVVSASNVTDLYRISDKYDVPNLKQSCLQLMHKLNNETKLLGMESDFNRNAESNLETPKGSFILAMCPTIIKTIFVTIGNEIKILIGYITARK